MRQTVWEKLKRNYILADVFSLKTRYTNEKFDRNNGLQWVLLKECRISNQNLLFQGCLTCSESLNPISDSFTPLQKAMKIEFPCFALFCVLLFNYVGHLRQIKFHSGYCFSIFMLKLVLSVVWNICSILLILFFLKRFGSYDGLK